MYQGRFQVLGIGLYSGQITGALHQKSLTRYSDTVKGGGIRVRGEDQGSISSIVEFGVQIPEA